MLAIPRPSRSFLAAVALVALSGCGPTVQVKDSFKSSPPKRFALLPIKAPAEVRPERINALRTALRAQFESNGYPLLDETTIRNLCGPEPKCPGRSTLADRFGAEGFISTEIDSISHNDVGLAFLNRIEGTIRIEDRNGQELAKIENAENERGGVLLDSGQLVQAVAEQVDNAGDGAFNSLAGKFARSAIEGLPRFSGSDESGSMPKIFSLEKKPVAPGVFTVCLKGTPNGEASIVAGKVRTGLRETEPGDYCGTFRSVELWKTAAVELRTAYGDSARQSLEIPTARQCRLDGLVKYEKPNRSLVVSCVTVAGKDAACSAPDKQCTATVLDLYSTKNPDAPIERLGAATAPNWKLPPKVASGDSVYVIARQPDGSTSPVTAVSVE